MSNIADDVVPSRKSSANSSTGSSFEKVENASSAENSEIEDNAIDPKISSQEEEKCATEQEDIGGENQDEISGNEENVVEPNELDFLNAPIKEEQKQFYTQSDTYRAIRLLIMFSSAMFVLPLLTMFTLYHHVFIDHYHLPPDQAMLYAGLCGMAVCASIVALFCYIAYREEVDAEEVLKEQKKDA